MKKKIIERVKKYRFEFKHLTILFFVLILFQIGFSLINKSSLNNFSGKVHEWYKRDSAERFANITATSLELIVETIKTKQVLNAEDRLKIIQAFNVIFSSQSLQQRVREVSLLVDKGAETFSIKDGEILYSYVYDNNYPEPEDSFLHNEAIDIYKAYKPEIATTGRIKSILVDERTFFIFVPFILRGENVGALYVKYTPDFTSITNELSAGYEGIGFIYTILIFVGFVGMYIITSNTIKERDEAQQLLFLEHEEHLKEKIAHENEALFTKRIYHTHHKAEKIMGFIKNDIMSLQQNKETYRVLKYSNFISRVIYDMKWYEPPINTIRNPIFSTNLNEVITFLRENIFLRITSSYENFKIILNLDETLPSVSINEFVIWEILEPLIQNSIDHGDRDKLVISISTEYNKDTRESVIKIEDNGIGIDEKLLERNSDGIRQLFIENISTKKEKGRNRGYGCFLAYTMAKERCGWNLDAENLSGGGARFIISYKN
ncbi:MAG: HAMP domain-containing histidine kinase [Melioribacteraceae bacterium]|nr:HAMP domain-containing histidine kinase [Melioribacteraceae bacterium]